MMRHTLPVGGLFVGLALLGPAEPVSAQQFNNRLGQAGVPAPTPVFNNAQPFLRQKAQAAGLAPNPNGGAPLINNGTNLINNNNGVNLNQANTAASLAAMLNGTGGMNGMYGNTGGYGNAGYGYSGYGNPYLNPVMSGNPYWFWGTGMPTGGYTPFYPVNPYSPQYQINMQALTNPYLNSLSNPAMSYPNPANVFNSTWALQALGAGNILQNYPQLGNPTTGVPNPGMQQPGMQQFP